jgi:FkbM family methyltransferase
MICGGLPLWLRGLLLRDPVPPPFRPIFRSLSRQSVAVDCGANVGVYTEAMARQGATVYAFEPNPHAFAVLQQRLSRRPRVVCINKAVGVEAGTARLFLHVDAEQDQLMWSAGSSLIASKDNVRDDLFVEVDVIDLDAFLASVGQRVQVLKIDIEGAEVALLHKLIATGRIEQVDHVLVEMHDRRIPSLREQGEALRDLITQRGLQHIRLDWI